jgi:hypothetical protein
VVGIEDHDGLRVRSRCCDVAKIVEGSVRVARVDGAARERLEQFRIET